MIYLDPNFTLGDPQRSGVNTCSTEAHRQLRFEATSEVQSQIGNFEVRGNIGSTEAKRQLQISRQLCLRRLCSNVIAVDISTPAATSKLEPTSAVQPVPTSATLESKLTNM